MSICISREMSIWITREISIWLTREMSIWFTREILICITREMSICFTREMSICIAQEMYFYARETKNSQYVKALGICQVGCVTGCPVQNAYNFKLSLLYGMTFIHVVLLHLFLSASRSLKFTHKAFLLFENKIYYLLKGHVIRFT